MDAGNLEHQEQGLEARSDVVKKASQLADVGVKELESVSASNVSDNNASEIIKSGLAKVAFGVSVGLLEKALVNREFDNRFFIDEFNNKIGDLRYAKLTLKEGEPEKEPIADDKWQEMMSLAKTDPTLTSFFDEANAHFLPNRVASLFKSMKAVPVVREKIAPQFKVSLNVPK